MRRGSWLACWLFLVIVLVIVGGRADGQESTEPAEPPPSRSPSRSPSLLDLLVVEDLDGRAWDREQLDGRVVLVDFWATWCAPCLAQMPELQRLYRRYRPLGFELVAVSIDAGSSRRLRSWLRPRDLPWPQVHRPLGLEDPLVERFGVEAIPRSFLFDGSGRLVAVDLEPRALAATLDALLAENR